MIEDRLDDYYSAPPTGNASPNAEMSNDGTSFLTVSLVIVTVVVTVVVVAISPVAGWFSSPTSLSFPFSFPDLLPLLSICLPLGGAASATTPVTCIVWTTNAVPLRDALSRE